MHENLYNIATSLFIEQYGHLPFVTQDSPLELKNLLASLYPTKEKAATHFCVALANEGMRIEDLLDKFRTGKREDDDFYNLINKFDFDLLIMYRAAFPGPLIPPETFIELCDKLKLSWAKLYDNLVCNLRQKCEILKNFKHLTEEHVDAAKDLLLTRELSVDAYKRFSESTKALKDMIDAAVLALFALEEEKKKEKLNSCKAGHTQKYVASLIKVSVATVANWENGRRKAPPGYSKELRMMPTDDALLNWARHYNADQHNEKVIYNLTHAGRKVRYSEKLKSHNL